MAEKYIEVGMTALRDPATGGFLPSVPLYIKADDRALEARQSLIDDIGHLFALRMKQYLDGVTGLKDASFPDSTLHA